MSENTIRKVGVIGAGTMGREIALNLVSHGFDVRLLDASPEVLSAAEKHVHAGLERSVTKGRMDAAEAGSKRALLQPVSEHAELADRELVIEAIVEVFDAKQALFASLDPVLSPDAVLATNTSSFRVSDLAASVNRPERVVGLHYFFPAAVNPVLEVIRGDDSTDAVIDRALAFARASGKTPLPCRDVYGFAVNRFFVPYLNEAVRLLDEGESAPDIEKVALDALGAAVGPFRVMDLSKTIIALHACRTLARLGPFYDPAPGLVAKGNAGDDWSIEPASDVPPDTAGRIRDRLLGAIFLAVLEALDQDVADPEVFDVGASLALKWKRPPCELMRELGEREVHRLVSAMAGSHGARVPASLEEVLEHAG